ncbi:hypothetical protein [Seonamhaeicola marinus]|uniref:DUF4377 domain-containing protein n=1 Tax=Seonamhaeicola marinus TaxID=1912246 RepID=A0A5D0HXQ0_9FLAO|nr:hypothetical protein [Seonamhaeicola marinus]TYA74927.1 hypothetical protein FUA24_16640 [Seonamhaeicola marinus]
MQTPLVMLLLFATLVKSPINTTVEASFDYIDEDGTLYFTENNEKQEPYEFERIDDKVLKVFNLRDKKFVGKVFNVTYRIETEKDELGQEYYVWVIVQLELVE